MSREEKNKVEKDNEQGVENEINGDARVQAEINGDARAQADFDLNEIPQDEGIPLPQESMFQVIYMMWSIYFPIVLKLFE